MEITITLINILFFTLLISVPFLFSNWNSKGNNICNLFTVIISMFILTVLFAWWNDFSVELLLLHYGYDPYNSSEEGILESVGKENFERVMQLRISHMGIGWTLKAMFGMVPILIYSLISYNIGRYIFFKNKLKTHT
ncbi:MAG: hypothetical protein V4572_09475 [Bacteroidota bacterium]